MPSFTSAKWWVPGQPERSLSGVLHEDAENRWILELDGSFGESPFDRAVGQASKEDQAVSLALDLPGSFPLLIGTTTGGKYVSLFECQVMAGSYPFVYARGSMKVLPRLIVYDVHFDSWDDFRLTSLSMRVSNLDSWAATSGITARFNTDVRHRFQDLIIRWYERSSAYGALSDLYFGTYRSPFMYVEHKFLNMFNE
ncbi:MAG: hypothetical protein WDO18_01080 [Acidobacteriota bacterium]